MIDGEEADAVKVGHKARTVAERIADYLRGLARDVRQISVRQVKAALGELGVAPNTFTRAVHEAASLTGWVPVGRSLMRTG